MKKFIFFSLIFLLIFSSSSLAIKIQFKGDNKIFFQPNLRKDITIIVSEAERNANVQIDLKGDYAKYASIDSNGFAMRPGEQKQLKLTVNLPKEMPDGIHTFELSATEVPQEKQEGAFIWIPAVGVTFKIINTDIKQDCFVSLFSASLTDKTAYSLISAGNNGLNEIQGAFAELTLYDAEGIKITSWKTKPFSVPPFDSETAEATASIKELPPGNYLAKGTLHCGNKKLQLNQKIVKGVTEVKINDFRLEKDKSKLLIEFDLENEFTVPTGANSMIWFYQGEKHVDHYSLPGVRVPAMGEVTLGKGINVDVKKLHVPAGEYTIKAELLTRGGKKVFERPVAFTEEDLSTEKQEGGFKVDMPEKPAKAEQIALEEKSKPVRVQNSMLIRVLAGLIILVVLALIIFTKYKRM